MKEKIRILILEDFPEDAKLIDHAIKKENIEFVSKTVDHGVDFQKELISFRPDIVLSDFNLPDYTGLDAIKFVLKNTEYKNVCEIDKNHYTNNICINPDLSYFPCMALTHRKYRGEKILPFEELKIENKSISGFLVRKPLMKECEDCRLFLLGVCQAACYSYVE